MNTGGSTSPGLGVEVNEDGRTNLIIFLPFLASGLGWLVTIIIVAVVTYHQEKIRAKRREKAKPFTNMVTLEDLEDFVFFNMRVSLWVKLALMLFKPLVKIIDNTIPFLEFGTPTRVADEYFQVVSFCDSGRFAGRRAVFKATIGEWFCRWAKDQFLNLITLGWYNKKCKGMFFKEWLDNQLESECGTLHNKAVIRSYRNRDNKPFVYFGVVVPYFTRLWWSFLTALTFGLGLPFVILLKHRYFLRNSRMCGVRAKFKDEVTVCAHYRAVITSVCMLCGAKYKSWLDERLTVQDVYEYRFDPEGVVPVRMVLATELASLKGAAVKTVGDVEAGVPPPAPADPQAAPVKDASQSKTLDLSKA